jgi:hypothetical protein
VARTPTVIDNDRLMNILKEVEGETGLKNRGLLYTELATRYNDHPSVVGGEFKKISPTIARWRLDKAGVTLRTPLGKRTKKEILESVDAEKSLDITITEETPDGSPISNDEVAPSKQTKGKRKKSNEGGLNLVKIPRGECPLPLTSYDHDNIINWATRMREVALRNGEYLMKGALQYYIKKNIIVDDVDKAREVCDVIRNHIEDEY